MRRPLRFLIEHLGLDEAQANEIQRAFEDLRLEREQADLDRRKAQAKLADLLESATLDAAAVDQAAEVRVAAAKREKDALVAAFGRIHAALTPEQRPKVAGLLRSGPFAL
jgi:Spy/CpxP family protein refolding chaperone